MSDTPDVARSLTLPGPRSILGLHRIDDAPAEGATDRGKHVMPRRHLERSVLAVALALAAAAPARAADLVDLYSLALDFDPQFQAARHQLQIAEQALGEARAQVRPTVNGSIQSVHVIQDIRDSEDLVFSQGRSDFNNTDVTLSLNQPLYRAATFSAIDQAQAAVRQARFELLAAEQELMFRVSQVYFDALAGQAEVDLALTEATAIRRQLEESEERLSSGLATITEVHEARARFALGQASEIDARDILDAAMLAISEITGSVPAELASLSETYPLATPDRPNVEAWVEQAMFRNPRLNALEAQIDVLEEDYRRQLQANRVPALDFIGAFDYSDRGGTEFGGGREIATTNVGLRLSVPIWDGGRGNAVLEGTALRRRQLLQRLELERRQVEREARQAFQGVVSGITRVDALQQSVFSQETVLSQRDEGLRAGVSTAREVLDARRDLFQALRDLARARYRAVLSALKLKQMAGILSREDLREIDAYIQ